MKARWSVWKNNRDGWNPQPSYGEHDKPVGAMRAYITAFEPTLANASDAFIRKHWPSFRTNHSVKIERTKST